MAHVATFNAGAGYTVTDPEAGNPTPAQARQASNKTNAILSGVHPEGTKRWSLSGSGWVLA